MWADCGANAVPAAAGVSAACLAACRQAVPPSAGGRAAPPKGRGPAAGSYIRGRISNAGGGAERLLPCDPQTGTVPAALAGVGCRLCGARAPGRRPAGRQKGKGVPGPPGAWARGAPGGMGTCRALRLSPLMSSRLTSPPVASRLQLQCEHCSSAAARRRLLGPWPLKRAAVAAATQTRRGSGCASPGLGKSGGALGQGCVNRCPGWAAFGGHSPGCAGGIKCSTSVAGARRGWGAGCARRGEVGAHASHGGENKGGARRL